MKNVFLFDTNENEWEEMAIFRRAAKEDQLSETKKFSRIIMALKFFDNSFCIQQEQFLFLES